MGLVWEISEWFWEICEWLEGHVEVFSFSCGRACEWSRDGGSVPWLWPWWGGVLVLEGTPLVSGRAGVELVMVMPPLELGV